MSYPTWVTVYVDSGSTDESLQVARSTGAELLELDSGRPFSAARARNAGFERIMQVRSQVQYVFFIDGDCEAEAGWLDFAAETLNERKDVGVVCGRLRELHPEHSIYNRACQVEWDAPVGEVQACGGVFLIRADAFSQVGTFARDLTAGEEPELCQRLRASGWKILRVDRPMATHDAAMLRFGQWWRRQVRCAFGAMEVEHRMEANGSIFAGEIRAARLWGLGWPVVVALLGLGGAAIGGPRLAVGLTVLVVLALPVQMLRVSLRTWRRGHDIATGLSYGLLVMFGKWPQLAGQAWYLLCRGQRRTTMVWTFPPASRPHR